MHILRYNRPRFFETEENSLPTIANINISNSNLIIQTASIDILVFHGMILHWFSNARYLLLHKTCKLLLSVSN